MKTQELVQECRSVMRKSYCNGISINKEKILETDGNVKVYLDYFIPRTVLESDVEHVFYYRIRNVGLISVSSEGKVITKSSPEELMVEATKKYMELLEEEKEYAKFNNK